MAEKDGAGGSVIVLGLSGALKHDPAAALVVDGEIVAAAEEERFIRDKHAKDKPPLESARFCLEYAGVDPQDVDYVAFPYAPISIFFRHVGTMRAAIGTPPIVPQTRY